MGTHRDRVKYGAFFLANDKVWDLSIAFLNSFRLYNPDMPLCLIPFDDRLTKIRKLKSRYQFSIFSEKKILDQCDRISTQFLGEAKGECRKLAMWEGPFEKFIYFDVDTVLLRNAEFVFSFLRHYDFIVSQSNVPDHFRFVWRPSAWKSTGLERHQIQFSGTTGFLASQKRTLSVDTALKKMEYGKSISPHMARQYPDQALLNFLIVTSQRRYTGLNMIAARHIGEEVAVEKWAGTHPQGFARRWLRETPSAFFVHWAGIWQRGGHKKSPLWNEFRRLPKSRVPNIPNIASEQESKKAISSRSGVPRNRVQKRARILSRRASQRQER